MKKLLVILTLPLFLMSCGGDGTSGTNDGTTNTYDSSSKEIAVGFWTMLPAVINSVEDMLATTTEAVDPESISFNDSTCGAPDQAFINSEGGEGTFTLTNCEIVDYFCGNSTLLTFNGVLTITPKNPSTDTVTGNLTTTGFLTLGCSFNFDVPSGSEPFQIDQLTGTVCGVDMATLIPMATTLFSGDNDSICDSI